jgi:hypothetical protein
MSTGTSPRPIKREASGLSLDSWAVILALVLTLAVKLGLFTKVPW